MKQIVALGIVILTLASASTIHAQITAYANICAEVISPAYIEKTADLTFNEIDSSVKSGAVILNASDNFTPSGLESAGPGKGTLASFSIAGNNHPTFDISLPNEAITLERNGSSHLIISDFTANTQTSGTSGGTGRIINIGATLFVTGKQAAGAFADRNSFQVTFNYN